MVSEDMFDRHVTWAGSNADSLAVAIGVHAEVAGAELMEAQRFRDGPVAQQVTSFLDHVRDRQKTPTWISASAPRRTLRRYS